MRSKPAERAHLTYDRVAEDYDDLWSPHVAGPNARLTTDLALKAGDRTADLACGTGVFTLEMARHTAPGETVAVDYSEGMLAAARDRAEEAGASLTLVHARAEDFIARCPPASFDVVSLRFVLAYIDWRDVLPRVGRIVRPGGRVGVLTSTEKSIPQLHELFDRYRNSLEPVWRLYKHCRKDLGATWKTFRQLRETFADGHFIAVPPDAEGVARLLAQGGLRPTDTWTDTIRLWFESGRASVDWLRASGYTTHDSLDHVGPHAARFLEDLFAAGMEGFRESRGVPLDLVVGGVVAERR